MGTNGRKNKKSAGNRPKDTKKGPLEAKKGYKNQSFSMSGQIIKNLSNCFL